MEINEKYLNIPPYLSTTWRNVRSLHMKGTALVITLADSCSIEIPQLTPEIQDKLFSTHAKFLDQQGMQRITTDIARNKETSRFVRFGDNENGMTAFRMGVSGIEGIGTVLQHNPAQADSPELPSEFLDKISSIARIAAPNDNSHPKAEPHCNCVYCQIARAIHRGIEPAKEIQESELEEVKPEDITFREWDILKTGENLYSVGNPLDEKEKYSVYLGKPIGCTCGNANCEHILAVLRS